MSRVRTQQKLGALGTHTHVRNHTLSSQLAPVTVRLSDEVTTFEDVVTPNFNAKLRAGVVINNPCTRTKTVVHYTGGGSYYGEYKTNPSLTNIVSGSGSITGFWLTYWPCPLKTASLPAIGDEVRQAQVKALGAIDDAPYAVAEDIATIKQTLRFIRKPGKSLADLSKRFAKMKQGLKTQYKHGARRRSFESELSSAWLEYRFAFMPLTRSIVTVIDSLERPKRRYDRIQTAHGTVSSSKEEHDTYGTTYVYARSVKTERTVRAVVQYRTAPPLEEWRFKYGLRTKDIPELMWDLFPYSFMIDRVVAIGSSIRGLTTFLDPSIKILGATVSTTTLSTATRSVLSQTHAKWNVTIVPDVRSDTTESYVRSLWTPTALDLVPPVLPGGLVSSITNTADLFALILKNVR